MNPYHAHFILSTCGTALLTNQVGGPDERKRINQYSNTRNFEGITDQADRAWLSGLVDRVRRMLQEEDLSQVARMSAELNGLIKFYGGSILQNHDHHVLLCTDTWMGEVVATMEAEWLNRFCADVEVKKQTDLQTAEMKPFQLALSDLVRWSQETLPRYRENRYRIVFNLTGGFKSVQGFLQTLAMFYADEVVYIFQEADSLMRIPRLPIELKAKETVRQHLHCFRRLAYGLKVESAVEVPETFLMRVGGEVTLSPWGSLVWEQTKKQIYEEQLWDTPSDKLRFGRNFAGSIAVLQPDRLRMVNEKLDVLARFLETGIHVKSLDIKELKGNPCPPSTHEIDAWSDQDAKRIYGHFEANVFVLDKLDEALH